MSAVGKFSCEACARSYSWKPELAGKRVKCKCGQPLSVPASNPAAEDAPDGFEGLMPAEDHSAVAAAPAASRGGPACPSCNAPVDPAAVLCVNCGHNLKTGKKLKTTKLASSTAAAAATDRLVPGYRSYSAQAEESDGQMSKKQKMIIAGSCIGGLVVILAIVLSITIPASRAEKERLAKLNAKPAKLERILINSEKAGGLTEAIKQGTVLDGVQEDPNDVRAKAIIAANRDTARLNQRAIDMYALKGPELKAFFTANPKNHFQGYDNEKSLAMVEALYKLGATKICSTDPPIDEPGGHQMVIGMVAKLPTDPTARKKIFKWYQQQDKVLNHPDFPYQSEHNQDYLTLEFSE
jgi:hypothetical protein